MPWRTWFLIAVVLLAACRGTPIAPAPPSPTASPSPVPTATATVQPGEAPTASPTATASPAPSATPSPTPSSIPSPAPTSTSFNSPIATPGAGALEEDWTVPPPRPLSEANAEGPTPRRVPNARRSFWVVDASDDGRREITARLRVQTAHAAMWVEEGVWHDVRLLHEAAKHFETHIYTPTRAAFGSEWTPGIDRDPRIAILHTTGLGDRILGYTSTRDEYSTDVYPTSNEAEMITIDLERVEIGSTRYHALVTGGLVRLIHWHHDRNEERWVREGMAGLGTPMTGSGADSLYRAYLAQGDVSLTDWRDTDAHRGASQLLMAYVHQRFGDEGTRAMVAEPANGVTGFDAALQELETGLTFQDLFADWLATNYLDSVPETNDDRYTYTDVDLPSPTASAVYEDYPVRSETSVHQLGVHYVVLRGTEDLQVRFTGQEQTPLLQGVSGFEHPVWWSNRADESLAVLTRRFNLGGLSEATLTYHAWYDIETDFDYATVEISDDGGKAWKTLRTPSGTGANPHGNNPGWGYTGESAGWIREEVDISEWTGGPVSVRFSYLTDGAVTGEGLLLDDISISEIDSQTAELAGDGKGETSPWNAEGFVLTDGLVRQRYLALLISRGENVAVERLQVGEDQTAEWILPLGDEATEEAVLILSALAPQTRQPAPYQLAITQQ